MPTEHKIEWNICENDSFAAPARFCVHVNRQEINNIINSIKLICISSSVWTTCSVPCVKETLELGKNVLYCTVNILDAYEFWTVM